MEAWQHGRRQESGAVMTVQGFMLRRAWRRHQMKMARFQINGRAIKVSTVKSDTLLTIRGVWR